MRDSNDRCSEINSLGINSTPEDTGVTSFVQEACDQKHVLGQHHVDSTIYERNKSIQSLTDYFSRPTCIATGTLPLGTRTRVASFPYTEPNNLLAAFSNYQDRLAGVYGVRFTTVFTLQVAATPFHQGILALGWQYGIAGSQTDVYDRGSESCTVTQLPHVRLDLSNDTMVQLKVPFINTFEFAPVQDKLAGGGQMQFSYGTLSLNTLVYIASVVGISAPTYQLYVHFEDMEFYGARPLNRTTIALQSSRKLSPVVEEFEKESHPYSSALMAASRVVKWVSMGVPAISSIGGPTSWFMAKAAGALRSFGFATPTITEPPMRSYRTDYISESNVDVPSGAFVVGPLSTNTLRVGPEFGGTDVDEMALKFITSTYSQINGFNMLTTNASGTLKYLTPISPSCFWYRFGSPVNPTCNIPAPTVSGATANSFQPSGLFFMSSMFKYWRGSMKFRFTFAKTKMHGGRVMVTYTPSPTFYDEKTAFGSTPAVELNAFGTVGPEPFGYSAIFNLRDGNVFDFEVPYISQSPYMTFNSFTGTLSLHVVDPLQAPAVVSANIGVMVEVAGGSDFELADPRTPLFPVHNAGTIRLQSSRVIGAPQNNVSEFTVGESMSSVKQLITIPKVTLMSLTGGTTTQGGMIMPWYYQPTPSVLTPGPAANLGESFSFGGNIGACYTFRRGSTDFHFYRNPSNSAVTTSHVSVYQIPNVGTTSPNASPAQCPYSSAPRVTTSVTGALHARLPQYAPITRFTSYGANVTGQAFGFGPSATRVTALDVGAPFPQAQYSLSVIDANPGQAVTSRAASDDAMLSQYIGPPPLLLLVANPAALYDVDSTPAL